MASPDEQGQSRSEEPAKPKGKYDHLKPTQFKPGQSGNPNGRPKGESLTATIRRLLAQEHNGRTVQEILAEKVIKEALSGKFNFAKELFDRVEGRPAQKIEIAPQENLHIVVPAPRTFKEAAADAALGSEPPDRSAPVVTRKVIYGVDPEKL